jgi:two-component system, cell cycle sensor histidine kinase and response regulator CckA
MPAESTYKETKKKINPGFTGENMLKVDIGLSQILQGNPIPIFAVNTEHIITHWNRACEHLTGIPADEMIGTKNQWMAFYSSKRPVMADLVLDSIPEREISKYYSGKYGPLTFTKDGYEGEDFFPDLGPEGKWLSFTATSLKDNKNRVIGAMETFQDITERKRMERELRENEAKYKKSYEESKRAERLFRSLIHSSADAIVIYDMKGRVQYLSPAFTNIFGWSLEEMEGKHIPYLPESEKESTMAIINDLAKSGIPCHSFETKRLTKKGEILDTSISASRYDDHLGNPAGMLVILRDISEKKSLETQLQYAQKMEAIGTLAGGIAHNFNNLLMGIMGNTSIILLSTDHADSHYERLKVIEKLAQNGSKLTKQLLGYAREGKYKLKTININKVIKETSETFETTKKEIEIYRELSEDLYKIKADEGQIEQVLLNLYLNASDAMPKGGKLFLQTKNVTHSAIKGKSFNPKPGAYVLIAIKDFGIGMDKKTMEQIFHPFFTTKGLSKGTGLGLASAYGIIKAHGGYINVASEKEQGTTFTIYLPASNSKITEKKEVSCKIKRGTETVLFVDDEDRVLDVGKQMLEALGYNILTARGGREALAVYGSSKGEIDLVILDMIMPEMGGEETFSRMKEIDPEIKVLLSSGYSIEGQATEILNRGCNGFIQKPFNINDLSHNITRVLNNE